MAQYFDIQSHTLPGQYIREYPAATANSQEDTLHLHVKQYTPLHRTTCPAGAVTIIAAHANGFPKVGLNETHAALRSPNAFNRNSMNPFGRSCATARKKKDCMSGVSGWLMWSIKACRLFSMKTNLAMTVRAPYDPSNRLPS